MSSPTPPQPEPPSAASGQASNDSSRAAAPALERRSAVRKPGKAGTVKPVPEIPRCNWVSVRRAATDNEAVTGQYVLDPTLKVAPPLLSNPAPGGIVGERPTLEVLNQSGNVDVDVWISVGQWGSNKHVGIYLEGRRVTLRLHSLCQIVVHLVIDAAEVSVDLPQGFRGALHTNIPRSRTYFSRDLLQQLVVIDDGPQSMNGCIGYSGAVPDALTLSRGSVLALSSSESYISLRLLKKGRSMQKSLSGLFKRRKSHSESVDCQVQ